MLSTCRIITAVAMGCLLPSQTRAQSDAPLPNAEDCAWLLQRLGTSIEPAERWGNIVRWCPEGPRWLRDSVARWRRVSDTVTIVREEQGVRGVRDGELAEVALALMADESAPELARIAAMSVVSAQILPVTNLLYATIGNPYGCIVFLGYQEYHGAIAVSPNHPDLLNRVLTAGLRIIRAPAGVGSPRLRSAAGCLIETVLGKGATEPIDPRRIRLTYLCGNRFRIRSSNAMSTTVTYDVYGTTERGWQTAVGAGGSPYTDMEIETVNRGTVRLFLDGKQIDMKANGNGPPCKD